MARLGLSRSGASARQSTSSEECSTSMQMLSIRKVNLAAPRRAGTSRFCLRRGRQDRLFAVAVLSASSASFELFRPPGARPQPSCPPLVHIPGADGTGVSLGRQAALLSDAGFDVWSSSFDFGGEDEKNKKNGRGGKGGDDGGGRVGDPWEPLVAAAAAAFAAAFEEEEETSRAAVLDPSSSPRASGRASRSGSRPGGPRTLPRSCSSTRPRR